VNEREVWSDACLDVYVCVCVCVCVCVYTHTHTIYVYIRTYTHTHTHTHTHTPTHTHTIHAHTHRTGLERLDFIHWPQTSPALCTQKRPITVSKETYYSVKRDLWHTLHCFYLYHAYTIARKQRSLLALTHKHRSLSSSRSFSTLHHLLYWYVMQIYCYYKVLLTYH
jgi:hypothetical protein